MPCPRNRNLTTMILARHPQCVHARSKSCAPVHSMIWKSCLNAGTALAVPIGPKRGPKFVNASMTLNGLNPGD